MLPITHTNFITRSNDNVLVYLVQNKKFTPKHQLGLARESVSSRIELFHQSLSYFVDHVHPDDVGVDIHIFHEGDLTTDHILRTAKTAKRFHVFFHSLHFEFPSWLDKEKVEESIQQSDIPGWRDMGYRHMCRFYSLLLYPKLIEWGYRKMMRLDDDSFPLENLPSLFGSVSPTHPYKARITQKESEPFRQFFHTALKQFCLSKGLPCPTEEDPDFYVIPFNNFFVVDLSLYQQPLVKEYLAHIDKVGGIYKYRWGDALVQGIMVKYVAGIPHIPLFTFRYAKWGVEFDEDFDHLELYEPPKENTNPTTTVFLWTSLCIFLLLLLVMGILYHKR